MTGGIRKLDENVARVVAAGPSVKCITTAIDMLLKNSVESGASEVEVVLDLENDAFSVRDNGCGMSGRDLLHFGQLGYSSKSARTSVFRHHGRSVYDISCMAKVTTLTRLCGESSAWLKKPTGEIEKCDCTLSVGTSIIVTDFFYNVPVRRKAFKAMSPNAIYEEIRFLVFDQLVLHSDLQVHVTSASLLENGFTILETPSVDKESPETDKISRCLFGAFDLPSSDYCLKPVSAKFKEFTIDGMISTRPSPSKQFQLLYIDGERCRDSVILKPILHLLSNARSQLTGNKRDSCRQIFPFVLKFSTCLGTNDTYTQTPKHSFGAESVLHSLVAKIVNTLFKLEVSSPRKRTISQRDVDTKRPHSCGMLLDAPLTLLTNFKRSVLQTFSAVNQVDRKFILLRTTKEVPPSHPALILMDQHACDERIKFESMLKDFICGLALSPHALSVNCQVHVTVTPREYQNIEEYHDEFAKWGLRYTVKASSRTSQQIGIEITGVPKLLRQCSKKTIKEVLLKHADDLRMFRKTCVGTAFGTKDFTWWEYIKCMPSVLIEILRGRACRSAIMFGEELSVSECELLVTDLQKCRNPLYCAHGRPSLVPITVGFGTEDRAFNSDYLIEPA
ncbi:LAME_0F12090g1_1 [Lachancea meyersii CBS 8951]|uniref:LAME_0F12090g1_1 n=1 Tax=Lachancea meyersii CBS 8951 TaxID=1266667 RepID=A0A1G4JWT4_9SACH|nr:LAME_0F12090g1_1 [Lachancea meyersii CBS 8951]